MVTESDSVIMQLVNKIINDAYGRRASDIHVEPNVDKKNVEIRFRVDGDCALYQTVPFSYRAALNFAHQNHVQPGYHYKAAATGR